MQKTMTRHAAVFRDSKLMAEGVISQATDTRCYICVLLTTC